MITPSTPEIKVRVRAVIIKNDKLLVIVNDRDGFIYLPGGKIQKYESIPETISREITEELGTDIVFEYQKLLYIQEFFNKERDMHSIEFIVLGNINKFEELEGRNDPAHNGSDHFSWIDIDKLPKDFKPKELIDKLQNDYKNSFINTPQYIGAVE
jgi:ADP-ribose pyrophosphatase YjhB (NUDIX family)